MVTREGAAVFFLSVCGGSEKSSTKSKNRNVTKKKKCCDNV